MRFLLIGDKAAANALQIDHCLKCPISSGNGTNIYCELVFAIVSAYSVPGEIHPDCPLPKDPR